MSTFNTLHTVFGTPFTFSTVLDPCHLVDFDHQRESLVLLSDLIVATVGYSAHNHPDFVSVLESKTLRHAYLLRTLSLSADRSVCIIIIPSISHFNLQFSRMRCRYW